MTAFWLVVLLVVFWLGIPCRYDPAIRLKEWLEGEDR